MGASKTIKVQPLSEAESWELFVELVGEHVADGIKCFAEKIVRRCQGLPLAIVTVAHAMANRHGVGEWANAVREMDLSATNLRGMINEVLLPLKFSFDRLEDDMLRSLFLYCACFPEDHSIRKREILCYCIGEGLVDRLGSLEGARNKGEALIGSLKIACMLENGEKKGSVKMHDMMRDLALWITSSLEFSDSSPKFLIRTGRSVKEAPKAHDWVDASRISLLDTEIGQLPELGEKCEKLTTLLSSNVSFGNNRIHNFIPPTNFFQHMNHLSILNLSDSQTLEYLPDSLSCLVNLRVLMLRQCVRLKALPAALGMLQQLQVLDLKSCEKLHQQILGSECEGGVSNLRYLDVSYSPVSIPAGVISRFHKLEELRLYGADYIKWKLNSAAEDEKWDIGSSGPNHHKVHTREEEEEQEEDERSGGTEGSSTSSDTDCVDSSMINNIIDVEELSHLTSLTSLTIAFENIIISDWFKPLAKLIMRLELKRCRVVRQDALQALNESQNLRFLEIKDCAGVTCVPTRVETSLTIDNCEDLEKVLDGVEEEVHHQDSFEGLNLFRLPNLNRICGSLAPLNCFAQLRWINISQCNSLKMVFTKGMPRLFNNLEWISVEECNAMKVIIEEADDEEEEEVGVISPFPRLRKLCLIDLPSLHDLCSNHILHCPIIREVYVRNCPRLKKGFLHKYETQTDYLSSSRGKSGRTKAIMRSWKRKLLKLLRE
ncbi:disease resistance protein RPS2-like [Macadamia integrifolia]|uniref:disease resistance protein RPS2-like n=1 Tax=Macadamia integrifolia TaxID=60698 RepID=UPI001C5272B9|nr:disease resistance protein RPS2-like [Macadamia integrifolia]